MRTVSSEQIRTAVRDLFLSANQILPDDAEKRIHEYTEKETSPIGKAVLCRICDNLDAARAFGVPICQDTGMAVLFAEVGTDVHIEGDFENAVNAGVADAYLDGKLRCSVVAEPFFNRKNTGNNTPAILYTRLVPGDRIHLLAEPKGFGSENMSAIRMFTPSATREDIIAFVVETVKKAGSNPCPPILVGVGIGGTFDYSAVLAKKALARSVSKRNVNPDYAKLEEDLLERINRLGIGPQGFGGDVTALGVNVEYYPTHIAGLPVAVNINCHVMRHAETVI
ncbi:MAG: fumarate hydratase [Eubacteriales bacterium]